jgi:hypothetical protein
MRIAVLMVMFCVLLQGLSKSTLFIRYQLNKKYYSEVLCSNRGLVVVDCEGKCRLLKDVAEEEKRSTNIPGKETIDISVLPPADSFNLHRHQAGHCRIMVHQSSPLQKGCISSLYKPPRFTPLHNLS